MQAPRWGLPKPSKAPKETPEQRQELEAVKQRIAQFASRQVPPSAQASVCAQSAPVLTDASAFVLRRWDVKRVEESGDAAGREARVGAAKALLTLATYLSTHPSARKPEVRCANETLHSHKRQLHSLHSLRIQTATLRVLYGHVIRTVRARTDPALCTYIFRRHLLTQDVNWVALLRPLLACEDAAPSCVRALATLTKLLPGQSRALAGPEPL